MQIVFPFCLRVLGHPEKLLAEDRLNKILSGLNIFSLFGSKGGMLLSHPRLTLPWVCASLNKSSGATKAWVPCAFLLLGATILLSRVYLLSFSVLCGKCGFPVASIFSSVSFPYFVTFVQVLRTLSFSLIVVNFPWVPFGVCFKILLRRGRTFKRGFSVPCLFPWLFQEENKCFSVWISSLKISCV